MAVAGGPFFLSLAILIFHFLVEAWLTALSALLWRLLAAHDAKACFFGLALSFPFHELCPLSLNNRVE